MSVLSVAADGRLTPVSESPFATGTYPQSMSFNSTGSLLAIANYGDDTISLFSVAPDGNLTPLANSPVTIGGAVESVAFSPRGLLATASTDGSRCKVSMFSVSPDGTLAEVAGSPYWTGGDNYEQSLAFSPSGGLLAVTNANAGTMTVFSVGSGGRLAPIAGSPYQIGTNTYPLSVAFDPSGALLAIAEFGDNSVSMFSTHPPSAGEIKLNLGRELTPGGRRSAIGALIKNGGYPVSITALRAGALAIDWYHSRVLVAASRATFNSAGTSEIKIVLTGGGARLLRHARRLELSVRGSFTPTGIGARAVFATRTVTLAR